MKYHLLILALTLSALCYAKDNTKDFIKLIKKHDVPQKARELNPEASPAEFWTMVLDDNSIIANLVKDISKGKGAEKDALAEINRMKLMDYRLQVNIIPEFKGYCDTLMMDMGLPSNICELNIINDPSPNAFATLTENGFAICLNSGLLERLDYDYERIMAVTAHEFAHGAFFHHLRTEYETAKKKRKDKVVGGIAMGLTAISAGADAYTSATLGTEYDPSQYEDQINKIAKDMKLSSIKFRYKYNREEELEADLVALRFMQHLGKDKKYQEALQMISSSNDYYWYEEDEFKDHPSTLYRLEFLNFVSKNPQHHNEVKLKEEKVLDRNSDPLYD